MTSRGGNTLVWDVENYLQQVNNSSGGTVESYLYDDNGIRVKRTVGTTSTYFPSPYYELAGNTAIKYYFFGGQRVAQKNGSTLYYLHQDHLGSTVLTTGAADATKTYRAYGNQRATTGSIATRHQFTDHYLDDTGLVYMNARYYDPALGAFVSPDTLVPDAGLVIDYNRYAYARGNSLKYNDPTGHQATCTMDQNLNMNCGIPSDTLAIDPAAQSSSSNPNGTRQFLTTMATVGVASFGGAFITPYLASLWPAAATAACADGDCTNEARTVSQASNYVSPVSNYLNRVSQIRSLLNIGQGRNVAVANYNIQGGTGEVIAVSGNAVRPGTVDVPTTRLFQTIVDNFPRAFDSEVKVLENIAQKFASSPGIYPNVQGQLTLFSERPLCNSCAGVVQQFQQMFPNITVEILTGVQK